MKVKNHDLGKFNHGCGYLLDYYWSIDMNNKNKTTREQIITSMCYTWRHDYGLDKKEHDGPGGYISVGLTDEERKNLWNQMAQLFDNDIAPHMEMKNE